MPKQRTATLEIYAPYGTSSACAVDVTYRGKRKYSFMGHRSEEQALVMKARTWSLNQGFTDVKARYVVGA